MARRRRSKQRRSQRARLAGGTDGGGVGALLGEVAVAIAQRGQGGQEEQRLAEDPRRREPQRIAHGAVVVLMNQDRRELVIGEDGKRPG